MRYREKLWPARWILVATLLVIPASALVFAPLSWTLGFATGIVLYAGCLGLYIRAGVPLEITDTEFRAGRARIDLCFIGSATPYSGQEATAQRGPELDARAWLLLRGGVSGVVRIEIDDPGDPTPYWLVSTRNPDLLVSELTGAVASRA
ncbi:DUF3093 domain-containing protein [Labedella endophytica]|uniref:DUF3093 domain-containing protein n=1 Tax=Labedella endophytica TaxID=1523160 RepID=A0A433JRA2_9MICO|nr:DUF3093 domain-containing protein [Labedella endophytica]RUR00761.1 DUF3093 domain-containing protein [Labedella endophytica]